MNVVLGIDGGGSHTRAVMADADGQDHRLRRRRVDQPAASRRVRRFASGCANWSRRARGSRAEPLSAAFLVARRHLDARRRRGRRGDRRGDRRTARREGARSPTTPSPRWSAASPGGRAWCSSPAPVPPASAWRPTAARHWCGGWEHLADDAGSAYWIAVEALRAAVRVEDGRLPPSALRDLVFNRWPLAEPRALAERLSRGDIDRASLATLAPEVIALAATDALAKLDRRPRGRRVGADGRGHRRQALRDGTRPS